MTRWNIPDKDRGPCPLCHANKADYLCECKTWVCVLCLYRGMCYDCMGWLGEDRTHLEAWLKVMYPRHLDNFKETT